jgi:hypothetical protein
MNRYIVDEFYRDPALRRQLFARARRERDRSVQAGLAWLKARMRAALHFCIGPLRGTERLV